MYCYVPFFMDEYIETTGSYMAFEIANNLASKYLLKRLLFKFYTFPAYVLYNA